MLRRFIDCYMKLSESGDNCVWNGKWADACVPVSVVWGTDFPRVWKSRVRGPVNESPSASESMSAKAFHFPSSRSFVPRTLRPSFANENRSLALLSSSRSQLSVLLFSSSWTPRPFLTSISSCLTSPLRSTCHPSFPANTRYVLSY